MEVRTAANHIFVYSAVWSLEFVLWWELIWNGLDPPCLIFFGRSLKMYLNVVSLILFFFLSYHAWSLVGALHHHLWNSVGNKERARSKIRVPLRDIPKWNGIREHHKDTKTADCTLGRAFTRILLLLLFGGSFMGSKQVWQCPDRQQTAQLFLTGTSWGVYMCL